MKKVKSAWLLKFVENVGRKQRSLLSFNYELRKSEMKQG